MAEGDSNSQPAPNEGQPPSNGSNLNQNNNNVNANTNSTNGTATSNSTGTNTSTGNNITVSIEYMYENPNGNVATNSGSGTPVTGTSAAVNTDTTAGANTAAGGAQIPGGRTPFPPGVVFLQFRDIPEGNSQERLQTIMSIASELAVRRMVDISALRFNKGISKEDFESLPVIPIKALDTTVRDEGCSICYEPFVDPKSESKKRSRGEDDEEKKKQEESNKRPTPDTGVGATTRTSSVETAMVPGSTTITATAETLPATPNSRDTTSSNSNENASNSNSNNTTPNDEEINPSYDHSAVEVPCKHVFGRECLFKWCKLENTCPLCRHVIAESNNTPMHVDPQQAASTTNAAFQRIHDLLYNSYNAAANDSNSPLSGAATEALRDLNNIGNNAAANDSNIPSSDTAVEAVRNLSNHFRDDTTANTNTTSPATPLPSNTPVPTSVPGSAVLSPTATAGTTTANATVPPLRTSNIIFITPQWYTPPNGEPANAENPSTNNGTGEISTSTPAVPSAERSPYERFRDAIGSYFDDLTRHDNANNNSGSLTPTPGTNSSAAPSTAASAPATPHATRNLDLLAMGNSIRNSLLQRRNMTANANGGAPTLFNSGVASYRNPSGNVSTYHLGAHEVFHASNNSSNTGSSDSTTETTTVTTSNDNNTPTTRNSTNDESNTDPYTTNSTTTDETNNDQHEDITNDSNRHS